VFVVVVAEMEVLLRSAELSAEAFIDWEASKSSSRSWTLRN
jgi:hypothetical protein